MLTDKTDFVETWLAESPSGIGSFDMLEYNIHDLIHNGFVPATVNELKKIELNTMIYYWYEQDSKIILGAEFEKKPQGLLVRILGKNPKWKQRKPFASDLYMAVLQDQKRSIRIFSDKQLSDEGFKFWQRLLQRGFKISVYDSALPGQSLKTFDSPEEMNQYFKIDDTNFERYQYVLSSDSQVLGETRNHFNNRRYRELAGLMRGARLPGSLINFPFRFQLPAPHPLFETGMDD